MPTPSRPAPRERLPTAVAASLPGAVNGVAPGPEILHRPPARAPQLENTGVWKADPTLVCMTSAYRAGEFLYQDCLWDDHGGGPAYRWYYYTVLKDYTYPTNPAYRNNAADIVEVRLKPLDDATAVRITYNTMTDPDLVATTIALGGDDRQPADVPHGANTKMPAQVFVTAHGADGDIVDAATGQPRPERPVGHHRPRAPPGRDPGPLLRLRSSGQHRRAGRRRRRPVGRSRRRLPGAPRGRAHRPTQPGGGPTTTPRPSSTSPSATTSPSMPPGGTTCSWRRSSRATSAPSSPRSTSPSWLPALTTTWPASPTASPPPAT